MFMSTPKCECALRWKVLGHTMKVAEVIVVGGGESKLGWKALAPLIYVPLRLGLGWVTEEPTWWQACHLTEESP